MKLNLQSMLIYGIVGVVVAVISGLVVAIISGFLVPWLTERSGKLTYDITTQEVFAGKHYFEQKGAGSR